MATAKPIVLNNVYSTVQAGSSAIGSSSATGINVASGDGANFGTIGTDEFIPAVIVDTSTTPETVKEYVWITSRSTDALTVIRQAEESSRYPASTTTIAAGYVIAAVDSKSSLDLFADLKARYLKPTAALVENFPRPAATTAFSGLSTGVLVLTAIALPANLTVGHLAFMTVGGSGSPTNWWFGLYDNAYKQLAMTADQTTTNWNGTTVKSLAVATVAGGSASSFTTAYTGLYYVGVMMKASTVVTLAGWGSSNATLGTLDPVLAGSSDSSQTTPPAFPHTATAPSVLSNVPYCYVAA